MLPNNFLSNGLKILTVIFNLELELGNKFEIKYEENIQENVKEKLEI